MGVIILFLCSSYSISYLCSFKKCPKIMPETAVETPAPPANETVKEEAVKADADNATEEKKDEEKPSEETKTKEAEAKEPKPKKEKKPKEPAPPPPPAVHKKDFEKEDPAANLTPEQKNVQHAMVTMVENHLQWAIMHWRVKNADNTLKGFHLDLQGMMGTKMPVALLNFVFKHTMLRKGMKKVKAA